jgi:D-alanyl-D-alanine dipeptidase
LVELITLDPSIHLDLRYATVHNFTGRILYSQARAFMHKDAAAALIRAHKRAQGDGYGLTIFDAYRPWRVTKQLWDATPVAQHQYVANPKEGSRHNRGCAIDLTLHRLSDGAAVEMPSTFDDFSTRAHRDFMGASRMPLANRARLARYMEAEQFEGRWDEWWHFDYRDWAKHPVLDVAFEAV